MKTLINIALTLICVSAITNANAQENLLPDQNPNYQRSMEKYMSQKDDLLKSEGTTVQATYKAIDDMERKREQRALRQQYRQERRLARINNRGFYWGLNSYYSPYNYGYNFSPGYYNGYGYGGYNSYNNCYPHHRLGISVW